MLNIKKYSIFFALTAVLALSPMAILKTMAQNSNTSANKNTSSVLPSRIIRPMVPLDPITLQAEGVKLRLWGVKMARTLETPLELNALEFVEEKIAGEPVNCKIEKIRNRLAYARCTVHTNEDLALALLQEGYVVVDRHQTYNSVFAAAYDDAQNIARRKRAGVWKFVVKKDTENLIPEWLEPYMPSLVPLSLVFGPIIGLLLIAMATKRGFSQIIKRQVTEFNENRQKEEALMRREKLVLAAALEGELEENKVKLEAFLTIYQSILDELLDETSTPKYKKSGDLIHKHPALNRIVFEGSINKLSALDMHIASTLSKLYAHIHSEPDYKTISPSVPTEEVVNMVKQTIREANALIPQIDYAIEQLQATMNEQLGAENQKTKKKKKKNIAVDKTGKNPPPIAA